MSLKLENLIRERRTIHDYKALSVEWSTVEKALELSLWALNHKLTFPWAYYRVGPKARLKIADIMVDATEKKKGPLSASMKESVRQKILNPAEIIFLGQKRDSDKDRAKEDYATLACSVQIASLYLWEQGIGSKWSTSGFVFKEKTAKALGIDSDKIEVVGCLFVGIGERTPKVPERPPLKKFLTETD